MNTNRPTNRQSARFGINNKKVRDIVAVSAGFISLCNSQLPATAQRTHHTRTTDVKANAVKEKTGGQLLAFASNGKKLGDCPLKHTAVTANISGYVARVNVKQEFHNPYTEKIEAKYTFPLSDSGAVDEMTMKIGTRVIKGSIKKREEAKAIYEQAKQEGHVASLLDQERTNIFNQSVANIEPGQTVEINISYVEMLPFEGGKYTYSFPMVVGPRFIPGDQIASMGEGTSPPTNAVPDADKITPHAVPPGVRPGHDISMTVNLDAGMPVSNISSKLHEVVVKQEGGKKALITLADQQTIPNKDFVLTWDVAPAKLESGYLTYRNPQTKEGFFTIMLVPPARVTPKQVTPKEMVFLIDCSGSQSGQPLQKAKDTLSYILDHMNPDDTFQIVAFSDTQKVLFKSPTTASAEMKAEAHKFINKLDANGGTWMGPAVQKVLDMPIDPSHLRIVTFMTDGYVGNDLEILGLIKKYRGTTRWFPFGTGNSVNRTLIDGIAKEGGGEPDYVLLNSSASEVGKKFYDKISSPVLTSVNVDFGTLPVKEVFPKVASDVWAQRPLYYQGRFTGPASGKVTLSGFSAGKPYKQELNITFPEKADQGSELASAWARAKVDRLTAEDYAGTLAGTVSKEIKDEITDTAIKYHIMTNYTSFVAVDESITKSGASKTVSVPVATPDGVIMNDLSSMPAGSFAAPMSKASGSGAGFGRMAYRRSALMAAAPAPTPSPAKALGGSSVGGLQRESGPAREEYTKSQVAGKPTVQTTVDAVKKKADDKSADDRAADETRSKTIQLILSNKLDAALKSKIQAAGTNGKALLERVKVTVQLNNVDAATLKALKTAGLAIEKIDGKTVRGTIALGELNDLATKLTEVTSVSMQPTEQTKTKTLAPHLVKTNMTPAVRTLPLAR